MDSTSRLTGATDSSHQRKIESVVEIHVDIARRHQGPHYDNLAFCHDDAREKPNSELTYSEEEVRRVQKTKRLNKFGVEDIYLIEEAQPIKNFEGNQSSSGEAMEPKPPKTQKHTVTSRLHPEKQGPGYGSVDNKK